MPITAKLDAFAAKLDEFGKPAWIALIVLGFMAWWPLGLAILAFSIWSGRMGCGYYAGHGHSRWQNKMERMQRRMDWMRARMGGDATYAYGPPSGNRAFDEYRADTLKRLEEEQRDFRDFLERLRMAKDKAEFDQFMTERRNRPPQEQAPPQN